MKKTKPAENPDAYVAALRGWQRDCVIALRDGVGSVRGLTEVVKWGHLVYLADGPVLLIRAEETRVLFGFWHGKRLRELEPRLKPGGKYEMATIELQKGDTISSAVVRRLVKQALKLNTESGDPRLAAKAR